MSLLPFLIESDPWELRRHCPRRQHSHHSPWDHFGLGMSPTEIRLISALPSLLGEDRNQLQRREDLPTPIVGKDGFQVHMDVQQFKPSEITVKTVNDFVVVEGKHEDRQDEHGFISRHFVRKYKLPKGYDANAVASTLSSDGVLTIKAPPPVQAVQGNERVVQITQTGPAHLNVKDNKPADEEKQNGDAK